MSDIERESNTSPEALSAQLRELRAEVAGLRRGRRRSRVAMVGAVAALALVGGGVALAVIPDPGTGVIHGCYKTATGALRVIDPASQSCTAYESALNWDMSGIVWRGQWSSTATYAANDAVAYNGSSYIAVTASTDKRPPAAAWATLSSGTLWQGAWSASKYYHRGAVVSYLGSSYLATKSSNDDPPTDTTNWNLLASRGDPGSDGASVLHGSGSPDNSIGADGDFYIDTAGDSIYGPKAGGAWPSPGTSLVGAPGAAGPGSTVISITSTNGSPVGNRDIPNSDLSVEYDCEAGVPFGDTTLSAAYLNISTTDSSGLNLVGVNTSTGNPTLEATESTPTEAYEPEPISQDGLVRLDAAYNPDNSFAVVTLGTEPVQGDAGATYGQFTIMEGSTAATVDLYLEADNTGTPSCTVRAVITPTSS